MVSGMGRLDGSVRGAKKTPPEGGVGGTAGGSAAGQALLVRPLPCLAVYGGAGWPIIS